jgi:hypothetical protein
VSRSAFFFSLLQQLYCFERKLLSPADLQGITFLDVGFDQGLALALATEAGAQAYGIDVDPQCVDALA